MSVPRPKLVELLAAHERLLILQALASVGFSRKEAAKVLGVSRENLWRRMWRLKISVPRTGPGRPRKDARREA